MTLPGVGAGNGNYATPSNTSLGSIGLGYICPVYLSASVISQKHEGITDAEDFDSFLRCRGQADVQRR